VLIRAIRVKAVFNCVVDTNRTNLHEQEGPDAQQAILADEKDDDTWAIMLHIALTLFS
jgi:hypothetical protein